MYQKFKDRGFIIITLLTENYAQVPPTQEDLQTWANEYGETFPVVSDGERYIHSYGIKGIGEGGTGPLGVRLPSNTLLGPGGEILLVDAGEIHEEDIEAALH